MSRTASQWIRLAVVASVTCVFGTMQGCAPLQSTSKQIIPDAQTQATATYSVHLVNSGGQAKSAKFPLYENQPLLVSQALKKSKAIKNFGKSRIHIERVIPGSQQRHKMPVEFKSSIKRVSPDHDYAIYPNDRIVVMEDSSSPLDDFFDGVLGQFGLNEN